MLARHCQALAHMGSKYTQDSGQSSPEYSPVQAPMANKQGKTCLAGEHAGWIPANIGQFPKRPES